MPSVTVLQDNALPPANRPLIEEIEVGDSHHVELSQLPPATALVEGTGDKFGKPAESSSVPPADASSEMADTPSKEDFEAEAKARQEALRAEFKKKHPNVLTKKFLKQHCKDMKLYTTPALNDVLYLHYKGIYEIENLEEYVGLKCLWLENNGIKVIENLDHQVELRCLYLQQNLIECLQNLEPLQRLDTLNVSNNLINKIENLACVPELHTLNIANNRLKSVDDIRHLTECPGIGILDLSHNKLHDPAVLDIFSQMANLRVLTLTGNPVIREVKQYRKTFIVNITNLQYLDDRPVSDKERACAEAWSVGGLDAEKKERQKWQDKENKRIMDSVDALLQVRKRNEAKRIEEELNARNAAEGIAERVEVDEESVDWLSGSYRLKGQDSEQGGTTGEDSNTAETSEGETEGKSACDLKDRDVEPEDLPMISRQSGDETGSIFSRSTRKSEGTRLMITQMKDEDSDQEDPEDLPELEDVEIVPVAPNKEAFTPKIEVLDDSDTSDDDDSTSATTTTRPLIQETNVTKRPLIQEISTSPPPTSQKPLSSPPTSQKPLICEILPESSPERSMSVVSLDQIQVESTRDQESDRLLDESGADADSSMIKSGPILNPNQGGFGTVQGPVFDVERIQKMMDVRAAGDAAKPKADDGLGELD